MTEFIQPLREAVNVADLIERDKLVKRRIAMRAEAVIEKATIERWNSEHPTERPIGTAFEEKVIAWLDGKGPAPTMEDTR